MNFQIIILLLFVLANCKKQDFSGSSTNPAAVSPSPSAIASPSPADPTPSTPTPTCLTKLSYKPEDILCHIPINSDTTWSATDEWKTLSNNFKDRQAQWLSPLSQTSCEGHACCPFVPNSNKLFVVSNFTLTSDDTYLYEVITDDTGTAKIWRNSDPSQSVLTSPKGKSASGSVILQKGQYAVIIEAIDVSTTATGAVFSLRNSQGTVIKHTTENDNWCIFQITASEVAETFLPAAAGCMKCFGRP